MSSCVRESGRHADLEDRWTSGTYAWDFSDGMQADGPIVEHVFSASGTYTIQLTVAEGSCTGTSVQTVVMNANDGTFPVEVVVPNVISPNGDGLNDRFAPLGYEDHPECYTVDIFNRWGQLVFDGGVRNTRWDGSNGAGERLPDGVDFYMVTVGEAVFSGQVQLVR